MYYTSPQGEKIQIDNACEVDITADIITAGKKAIKNISTGWFGKDVRFPAAVFYMLSSTQSEYFSGKAKTVRFSYYFEVRAKKERERDDIAKALSGRLSEIYNARRSQYSDSFENNTNTYIKRIEFTFIVDIRG